MYTKEDVQRLVADIGKRKSAKPEDGKPATATDVPASYIGNRDVVAGVDPSVPSVDMSAIELGEPYMFGLALDLFDPVSGQVFAVCRPHRMDVGDPEVFLTPNQIAAEVASARMKKLHDDRSSGIVVPPTDAQVAAAKDADAKKAEAAKVKAA